MPNYSKDELLVHSDDESERVVSKVELCPTCGAHLATWKEVYHEDHVCPTPTGLPPVDAKHYIFRMRGTIGDIIKCLKAEKEE